MNRLALVSETTLTAPSHTLSAHPPSQAPLPRHRFAQGFDLPYATFAPIHYESGYAYPLIVWLHDADSNEQELRQVMPLVSMRNYVAIAPRGTCAAKRCRGRFDWSQTGESIESAHSRIIDSVTVARERFNIHPNRIFLIGRGTGATMALRTAWSEPSQFAGVVAINGPLPSNGEPDAPRQRASPSALPSRNFPRARNIPSRPGLPGFAITPYRWLHRSTAPVPRQRRSDEQYALRS